MQCGETKNQRFFYLLLPCNSEMKSLLPAFTGAKYFTGALHFKITRALHFKNFKTSEGILCSMTFDNDRKLCLQKQDKSKIGAIDEPIRPLYNLINQSKDYYTTSSCSGRIVLMKESSSHKKDEAQWIFVSHEIVDYNRLKSKISLASLEGDVWFREEGMILHVACRTMDHAVALVSAAREMGLKRSGIISANNKIIVEILDAEKLEFPISIDSGLLVTEEYIMTVLDIANQKLKRTRDKIKKLEEKFSTLSSSRLS